MQKKIGGFLPMAAEIDIVVAYICKACSPRDRRGLLRRHAPSVADRPLSARSGHRGGIAYWLSVKSPLQGDVGLPALIITPTKPQFGTKT